MTIIEETFPEDPAEMYEDEVEETVDPDATDDDEVTPASEVPASRPTVEIPGFALAIEDRPVKVTRNANPKRELAWEEYLAFLKQRPGTTARVFMFVGEDAQSNARARARSMRARLVKTQPEDMWNVTAELVKEDGSYRVYATYDGPADDETLDTRNRIHDERVARGVAIAAARFGN